MARNNLSAEKMSPAAQEVEPLLQPVANRYVLFPIKYQDVWAMYKKAQAAFWTVEEISLAQDVADWNSKLTPDERHFIKHVLAFFAASDGIVNENLIEQFGQEIQAPEVRCWYGFQQMMENIHSEMYSTLIDQLIGDPQEKQNLFRALETMPAIRKKAEWALRYIDAKLPFAERLVAFAIVEGVFFSGSFASIFWLKERNLLPGLSMSNEFISRDEGMHTDFAVLLYTKHVKLRLADAQIHRMFEEAVAVETEFLTQALPVQLLGMNNRDMAQYVRYVADQLLRQLGHPALHHCANPFTFMANLGLETKTNFFERRVSEYKRAHCSLDTQAPHDKTPSAPRKNDDDDGYYG